MSTLKQKRSPWFSARTQPPVNGKLASVYEWRRSEYAPTQRLTVIAIQQVSRSWPNAQWRGLLREDGGKA